MPVDRTFGGDLAHALVDLYGDAEQRLIRQTALMLAAGIDRPNWATEKLAQLGRLRLFAERIVGRLDSAMAEEVERILAVAYASGGQAALDELARLAGGTRADVAEIREALPGAEAVQRLAFSLTSTLRGTHLRILRWDLDAYRDVIARTGLPGVLLGTETRRRAAQRAWEHFLTQGVTGFVDKSGRGWELASYVEMAVRTGTAQAAVQGHLDRLGGAGIDLVVVSNAPQECVRCRPWEGKVLDRNGPGGAHTVEVQHATVDDRMVRVHVAGSVTEAVAAGLMHPNCRHSLSGYLPGVTKASTHTADPDGDEARQQLRALERKVRLWKRRAVGALDPQAKAAAEAKVRDYQAQIRDHVDTTTVFRQRHREQIGQAR